MPKISALIGFPFVSSSYVSCDWNSLSALTFLYVALSKLQLIKGYVEYKLEKHALNLLIAGSIFWLFGTINNACQIYERADGHVQILQESVHIPFLMGCCLFLVGAILNSHEQARSIHHGLELLVSVFNLHCWWYLFIFSRVWRTYISCFSPSPRQKMSWSTCFYK